MSTISTERAENIDREDDQETPPGADRLTNLNTTLASNNNNNLLLLAWSSMCTIAFVMVVHVHTVGERTL